MEECRAGEAGEPQGAVSGAAHVPSWDLKDPNSLTLSGMSSLSLIPDDRFLVRPKVASCSASNNAS